VLLCHFVFDTTFTLLRRWRRGKNIVAAHRSHLYQRLVIAGWRYRDVTLLYLGLALLGAALAWVGGQYVGRCAPAAAGRPAGVAARLSSAQSADQS
jgi:UDP-N-acetylmuramyl pentapeptide phosphotransferase/UDP-N-acetylglucosamine-1-phosphate transferase